MKAAKHLMSVLLATVCLIAGSCAEAEKAEQARGLLPFVLKVNEISPDVLPPGPDGGQRNGVSTPAVFGDADDLRMALANALSERGIFTRVVTEETSDLPADLEVDFAIRGDDFGPGSVKLGAAVFSTFVWLYLGPVSWFIEDREYHDSNVRLSVSIRSAHRQEDGVRQEFRRPLFDDDLLLTGLDLSFSERADVGNWLKNIFVPPWWGDGNSERAGASLGKRVVEYFKEREPDRILSRLPGKYHEDLACFLVHKAEREPDGPALYIIAQQPVQRVSITSNGGGSSRSVNPELEALRIHDPERIDRILLFLSERELNIGADRQKDRFYRIPLEDDETGYVRVQAILEQSAARWTIFRPPQPESGSVPGTIEMAAGDKR